MENQENQVMDNQSSPSVEPAAPAPAVEPAAPAPAVEPAAPVEPKSQKVAVAPRHVGEVKIEAKKQKTYEELQVEISMSKIPHMSTRNLLAQLKSERAPKFYKDACEAELLKRYPMEEK